VLAAEHGGWGVVSYSGVRMGRRDAGGQELERTCMQRQAMARGVVGHHCPSRNEIGGSGTTEVEGQTAFS